MQFAIVFDPNTIIIPSFLFSRPNQDDFRKYIQMGIKCKMPPISNKDAKQEEKGQASIAGSK